MKIDAPGFAPPCCANNLRIYFAAFFPTIMKRPRFTLRVLLFLLALVCFALGYAVIHNRHVEFYSQQSNRAFSIIGQAFRQAPPGFEKGTVPWFGKSGDKPDSTYFDAWQREIDARHRVSGKRQADYFYTVDYGSSDSLVQSNHRINARIARTPEQLKQEMLNHFGNPLRSMGFVVTDAGNIEEISHGHRSIVTLNHPESELEVEMRFVFGRDGCTFVDIAVGEE